MNLTKRHKRAVHRKYAWMSCRSGCLIIFWLLCEYAYASTPLLAASQQTLKSDSSTVEVTCAICGNQYGYPSAAVSSPDFYRCANPDNFFDSPFETRSCNSKHDEDANKPDVDANLIFGQVSTLSLAWPIGLNMSDPTSVLIIDRHASNSIANSNRMTFPHTDSFVTANHRTF